jgi:hypothetical protein
MIISEILTEGAIQIMGRKGNKLVRKYRCTAGSRKGRIVASPDTCNKPKRVKSSINIKKAKARRSSAMKVASARTKRARGTTQRLTRINKSGRRNLKNIRPKTSKRKTRKRK